MGSRFWWPRKPEGDGGAGYTVGRFLTAFSRGVADLVAYQFVSRIFLGAEYALAAAMVLFALPESRWIDLDAIRSAPARAT